MRVQYNNMSNMSNRSFRALCLALTLSVFVPFVHAQAAQTVTQSFALTFEAEVAIDSKKAANSGMSDTLIKGLSGMFGGSVGLGTVSDKVSFTKDGYDIQSSTALGRVASLFMKGDFVRTSKGKIENNTLTTAQYVDIRPGKTPLVTVINDKKTVSFVEGKKLSSREPYRTNTQDILSMTYAFIGRVPAGPTTVHFSDGKSLKTATFDVLKESIKVPAGSMDAVKLTRRIVGKEDARIELWVRASDGLPVRLRVGMNEKYGALLDMKASQLPAAVAKY